MQITIKALLYMMLCSMFMIEIQGIPNMPHWGDKWKKFRHPISAKTAAHVANVHRFNALNRGNHPGPKDVYHPAKGVIHTSHHAHHAPSGMGSSGVWDTSGDINVKGTIGVPPYHFRITASDEFVDVGSLDVFDAIYGEAYHSAGDHNIESHQIHWTSAEHCLYDNDKHANKVEVLIRGSWGALPPYSHEMVKAQMINALWTFAKFAMKRHHYQIYRDCVTAGGFYKIKPLEYANALCGSKRDDCFCSESAMCKSHDWYHYLPTFTEVEIFDDEDRLLAERLDVTITVTPPQGKPKTKFGCAMWMGMTLAITTWFPSPIQTLKNFINTAILVTCSAPKGVYGPG